MKKLAALLIAGALGAGAILVQADNGFLDVPQSAWYADAVNYVNDNGLITGINASTFAPDRPLTRAMLAQILYRLDGKGEVLSPAGFNDVIPGSWYSNAIAWANQYGIMTGYNVQRFGVDDNCTRQDFATVLYRYTGSPKAESAEPFADEDLISDYAKDAADWAKANSIITGKEGNLFDPAANAKRAEAAEIFKRYLEWLPGESQPVPEPDPEPTPDPQPSPDPEPNPEPGTDGNDILVVYFSATNNTKRIAEYIADETGADLFELVPVEPYTSEDLSWTNSESRVSREHLDEALQNSVKLEDTTPVNWDEYETIFIGYPIWWGNAAWPVNSFITSNDFTGKTIVPFCTSSSSGLGQSASLLEQKAGTGNWLDGQRFSSGASLESVREWVAGLEL